ncbi:MAG: haloacid dehalogenase type II [Cyanothece sp. SIO1E1]|nr:haloacid dehalogenase type II [Cyanothece sp. SIO1E1]
MPEPEVQALVFDAYGTLFDVHAVIDRAETIFPNQGTRLSQIWRTKQLEYTWLLSLMGQYEDFAQVTQRALTFACKALNLTYSQDAIQSLMAAYNKLDLYPDVKAGLEQLSAHYPLMILSNGSPAMSQAAVEQAGLRELLQQILSADAVSIYKPSPQVYGLAVAALNLHPSAIRFVSSNAWDIAGAKAFGFQTCWINRSGQPEEELDHPANAIITQFTELLLLP